MLMVMVDVGVSVFANVLLCRIEGQYLDGGLEIAHIGEFCAVLLNNFFF